MGRVVLVTGVAGSFAARFSRHLAGLGADAGIARVVGIDLRPPAGDLGGVKFVRADIRNPVVGKVMAVEGVDTVVHLDVASDTNRSGSSKERNVIGTMQLLAACQRESAVEKFVLGSTTAVYGSSPQDPALFDESQSARSAIKSGYPKDAIEVEGYVRGFARRRPDVLITTLRSAPILHTRIDMPLNQYFHNPVLPVVMGYDPRLQFLHLDDAMAVLTAAVAHDRPGTFNLAGDGVILLSQAVRRLGRLPLPLPAPGFASVAAGLTKVMGSELSPDLHRFLAYGRAVDTTSLREIFGYEPMYSTEEVFAQYSEQMRPGVLSRLGRPA